MIEPSSDSNFSSSRPNPISSLTYSIYERCLKGRINGIYISYYAVSGGGGASKGKITEDQVVNSPYFWQKKSAGHEKAEQRGGPIPPGRYRICCPNSHKSLGLSAAILPIGQTKTLLKRVHRSGFFIHGAGYLGSDGCIVPPNTMEFKELMGLLSQNSETPLLVVETFMEDVKFA